MLKEEKELYEFGSFRLDVTEHRLERLDGHQNGSLPEKAFLTLIFLVRRHGRLVSKRQLIEQVWPDSFVEENNLDKCIHAIRHVLGEISGDQKYIETVRKHGYRFIAEVRKPASTESVPEASDGSSASAVEYASIIGVPAGSVDRRCKQAFEVVQLARIKYCQMTAPTSLEARALINEAQRLDPGFAPAHSFSAELTTLEVIVGLKRPSDGFAEARWSISRAYELGADSADFYAAAGYVDLIADWDFIAAEEKLQKALTVNPHYGPANRMLGETCMFQGRHDEAAAFIERAQVDELTGIHNANILAISHYLARRYPKVIEVCDQMLTLLPRHIIASWTKCWALEQMGRIDEAISGYEKIRRQPHGEPVLRWVGYAFAMGGDRERALEVADLLDSAEVEYNVSPTHAAAIFAALDRPADALVRLERSLELHDPWMLWAPMDPRFDCLRSDHRFQGIVRRVLAKTSKSSRTIRSNRPFKSLHRSYG